MRPSLGLLLPLFFVLACGGSTSSPGEQERVPAAPLPSETSAPTDRGPTGFVTLLTIDGAFNVPTAAFFEDAERTRDWSGTPCALGTGGSDRPPEVSAGTVTFSIPTRHGDETLDVLFDARAGEYGFASFEGAIEPGGILRVSAKGDAAPAFDAEVQTAANVVWEGPETMALDATAPGDLTLRWRAEGDNDEVFASVRIGDTSVTCWFDSRRGSGTIPATLLSALVKDPAAATCERSTCMAFLASKRTRSVAVGPWAMVLAHGLATVKEVRVTR